MRRKDDIVKFNLQILNGLKFNVMHSKPYKHSLLHTNIIPATFLGFLDRKPFVSDYIVILILPSNFLVGFIYRIVPFAK